jgi:hypothetical protein
VAIPKRSGNAASGTLIGLRSSPAPCVGPLGGLDPVERLSLSAGATLGAFGALDWDAAFCAGALAVPERSGDAATDALGRVGLASFDRAPGELDAVGLREAFAVVAFWAVGALTLGVACCAGALRRLDAPVRAAEPAEVLLRLGLSVPC